MKPKVSVLMSVYNSETFLRESIESILNQTYKDFEFIIIDDGSSDRSLGIIEEYACLERRIRFFSQNNMGLAAALNFGLEHCNGVYIARMDADDISLPHRIATQVQYLDSNPKCVLVGGLAEVIADSNESPEFTSGGRHKYTNLEAFPPKVAVSLHPLITVRKEAYDAIGGYRTEFASAQDYDLFIRLSAVGTIHNPNCVMLKYRKHAGSVSRNKLSQQERYAALSELQAVGLVRSGSGLSMHGPMPELDTLLLRASIKKSTFEFYVNFRIWRRNYSIVDSSRQLLEKELWSSVFNFRQMIMSSIEHRKLQLKVFCWLLFVKIKRIGKSITGKASFS